VKWFCATPSIELIMKLKVLAMLLAASATSAHAQPRWSLGVDYAAARTNFRIPDSPEYAELTAVNKRSGGVSVQWRASRRISLESGVVVGAIGTRWTEATTSRNLELRLPQLQIPMLANVRIGTLGRVRVDASAGAAYNRYARVQVVDRRGNEALGEYWPKGSGSSALVGAQFVYESRFPLRLAIRHSRGLTSVHKNESAKLVSTSAMLGVSVLRW
jgi:hypothetical protein